MEFTMPRANYDLPVELIGNALKNGRPVIAVQNEKGGVGKTPYTFHIAASLAEEGARVLCIDLDPQGDLTSTLTLYSHLLGKPPFKAADMAMANTFTVFDDDTETVPISISENLDLLIGTNVLVGLQGMTQDRMIMLREFVDAHNEYDFVFIDSPPTAGNYTTAGAMAASHVIIPVRPDEYPDKAMRKHFRTIERLKTYNSRLEVLGVIISDVRKNVNIMKDFIDKIRGEDEFANEDAKRIGKKVFNTLVHQKAAFSEATTQATPLLRYEKSELADQFYYLVCEMLERLAKGDQ
jgi:chromosome partitioning protein